MYTADCNRLMPGLADDEKRRLKFASTPRRAGLGNLFGNARRERRAIKQRQGKRQGAGPEPNQIRGGCAPGAHGAISAEATGPVVLGVFWLGSPLWQRRQYFRARARRLSILSWRLHPSEQKHDPRATRFSEMCDLQRTQKRSIDDIEFRLETRRSGNPCPFFSRVEIHSSISPVLSFGFSLCMFAVRVSQGREGRDGRKGTVGKDDRDGSDGSDAASSRSSGWGRMLAGILLGSNGIGAVAGAALGTDDNAGGLYIPAILRPMVGRSSGVGCTSSSCLSHGREASQGSAGREGAGGRVGICNHLGRAFGSKSNAIKLISRFLFIPVASGLRILQDFAGICRAILLKFFRVSTGLATHNP